MSTAPPRLALAGVSKWFGPTHAVADADIELASGEIHTLLGENGSGKSTIVKMIGGVHHPDSGTISLDGLLLSLPEPAHARRLGIATVFQEVLTVGWQSVYDNVWLGSDGTLRVRGRHSERRAKASAVLEELLGRRIDIDVPANTLSLSERQAVCIARALVTDPKVLILDESTASLDVDTRNRLFTCIRRLRDEQVGVLFISHRMDEITEISDRVTVLRSGKTVDTLERNELSPQRLLQLMTGASVSQEAREPAPRGDVVLSVEGLRLAPDRTPIEFTVRQGELIGLAGLEGHGQDSFLKHLAGLVPSDGRITSRGERVTAARASKLGLAYMPRERRGESLIPDMSIRENFALPTIGRDQRLLWSPRATSRRFARYVNDLRIRMGSDRDPISSLSGGNQQKVIMGRWLASDPQVLLLNDPMRGVDVGTKHEFYALLDRLCREGLAVVMLSSETDELIELMDRVLVFRGQEVSQELPRDRLDRSSLVAAYFGQMVEVPA